MYLSLNYLISHLVHEEFVELHVIRWTSCQHSQPPCLLVMFHILTVSLIKTTSISSFYDKERQKASNQQATMSLPHISIWTSRVVRQVEYCKSFTPTHFLHFSFLAQVLKDCPFKSRAFFAQLSPLSNSSSWTIVSSFKEHKICLPSKTVVWQQGAPS